MKSLFLSACFLYFSIAPAFAKENALKLNDPIDPEMISGAVKQVNTQKPIRDVTIMIIQQNTLKEKIIQSNNLGEFGINDLPPGTYKLVFQKDGYKKVVKDKITVTPNRGIELNIEMEEVSYDLNPSLFHFFKI